MVECQRYKSTLVQEVLDEIDEGEDDPIVINMLALLIARGADVNVPNVHDIYPLYPLLTVVREQRSYMAAMLLEVLLRFSNKEVINKSGGFSGATPMDHQL